MNRQIIKYAKWFSRALLVLCYMLPSVFLVMIIYWHFDPEAFRMVDVSNAFKIGFGVGGIKLLIRESQVVETTIRMSDLGYGMIYWLLFRAIAFSVIAILILRKIKRLLSSVNSVKIFYQQNIAGFQAIAGLSFVGFLLGSFNFRYVNDTAHMEFGIPFGPLSMAIGALVLAEVFKEGKRLLEDNNLII